MLENTEQLEIINDGEKVFVALDTETTGLSPIYNELIEVSAIKYKGKNKIETFSTLIKPKCEIPYHITKITGIDNDMVQEAPRVEKVMIELIQFIGKNPIVAHNASFDMGFLNQNSNGSFRRNKVIDTVALSRKMHPYLPNHKLGTVAKYLGVTEDGFHRAEFDCECCAKIYMKYLGLI